jgi:hypothetical protein
LVKIEEKKEMCYFVADNKKQLVAHEVKYLEKQELTALSKNDVIPMIWMMLK